MNLLVIIFFILYIFLYLIINKEDYASASTMEECKNCGMKIDSSLLHCTYCGEKARKVCNHCGRLLDYDWRSCPFCENKRENKKILKDLGGRK